MASLWYPPAGFAAAVVAGVGPVGLKLRGTTSRLAWTSRLRRLAGTSTVLAAVVVGGASGAGLHAAFCAVVICALGAPVLIDGALALVKPVEARLLKPYVDRARQRLQAVAPRVVAITGSYGKTTTKGYVAHVVGGSLSVVASPASFNNTVGLARAINEHLATGTQVFVAEMGTYGVGEISSMCAWVRPEVAVITAIGPVHLERMRTLERIAEAKAEILDQASVAVLNVDYPLLAQLAQKVEEEGKTVWRCSSRGPRADVSVTAEGGGLRVRVAHLRAQMDLVVATGPEVEPGNVACAVAAALSLGVPTATVAARLASLPGAPNRRRAQQGAQRRPGHRRHLQCQPRRRPGRLGAARRARPPGGEKGRCHAGHGRARPPPRTGKRQFRGRGRGGGHRARRGRPHQRPVPDGRGQGRRCTRPACPGPQGGRGLGVGPPRCA